MQHLRTNVVANAFHVPKPNAAFSTLHSQENATNFAGAPEIVGGSSLEGIDPGDVSLPAKFSFGALTITRFNGLRGRSLPSHTNSKRLIKGGDGVPDVALVEPRQSFRLAGGVVDR